MLLQSLVWVLAAQTASDAPLPPLAAAPAAEHGLVYDEPAATWDEAFPLGNGMLGALVWGDGAPLNISVDRTDLWDLRPVEEFASEDYRYTVMRQWEREGRYDELKALYEEPYHNPGPTRLPAGRITIDTGDSEFRGGTLDIAEGRSRIRFGEHGLIDTWVHATEPIGFIHIRNVPEVQVELIAPAFGGGEDEEQERGISAGSLDSLGYPPPVQTQGENWLAFEQEGFGKFRFAVFLVWKKISERDWQGAWSVASSFDGESALTKARINATRAIGPERKELVASHDTWWREYWNRAWVELPDPILERQYYLDAYKLGGAVRRGAPPVSLQGPWTADNGKLPPWKGDYHHDLNTEMSYWPAYTGNRLQQGMSFIDWLWATKANSQGWTEYFFRMPGLNVPMSTDLYGNQIGGWRQYTHSATTAAWLAHHFYQHWDFTRDQEFLRHRAYPWFREVANFLRAITTERDEDGTRTLPLSSSPEIHDNKPEAWFPSITNYDNALIQFVFNSLIEFAEILGEDDEVTLWREVLADMPPLAIGNEGLLVADGHPLEESHRHLSHLMALHPLALIHWESSEEARNVIRASLGHLEDLGTSQWTGYSFAWWAHHLAWAHQGEAAAAALRTFAEAFVLRNSFHCNGDQSGEGHSNFTYRPFTLEGNFGYLSAVHEMLLQSHAGLIDVFPALPESWKNVRFENFRARGAFLVSAALEDGNWSRLEIYSIKGSPLTVRSPATGQPVSIDLAQGESVLWQDGTFVLRSEL